MRRKILAWAIIALVCAGSVLGARSGKTGLPMGNYVLKEIKK